MKRTTRFFLPCFLSASYFAISKVNYRFLSGQKEAGFDKTKAIFS